MALSFKFYRSEINATDSPSTNGGYPITEEAPAAGTLPTITSAADLSAKNYYRKIHQIYTGSALEATLMIFRQPPWASGKHYFTLCFEPGVNHFETEATMLADLANRRQYGQLELTQAATAGVSTTLAVKAKSRELLDGDAQIIYANGSTLTDLGHLDARLVGDTSDTAAQEDVTVTDISNLVTNPDGTATAVLTLSAAVTNSYAIGAKFQTWPDKDALAPVFDSLNTTNLGTGTFNIALVEGNGDQTWEDLITLNILNSSGDYTASSLRFGAYAGTGNKDSDFTCTNTSDSHFTSHSFKIKAGALGGTLAAGQSLTFRTHYQGRACWILYWKPANSGIIRDYVSLSGRAEEDSV